MKSPVLLCYNLTGDRAAKIKLAAMRLKIRIRQVLPLEYGQTLAALCGQEPLNAAAQAADDFADELLVMANFPDSLVRGFLAALRTGKLSPVALKAVLTDTNSAWDSYKLHAELSAEREAILAQRPSAHESGKR